MDLSSLHRFHVAPGYDPAHPETWVWTDRSADVNHKGSTAVTITGGRSDETGTVNPGSAILEVDNAGGHYCTRNPYGRWYGLLARNCPARWGTISGAESWAANTTNGWGLPDVGASWSLSGAASDWSSSGGVGQVSLASAGSLSTAQLNGGNARDGDATFVASVPAVATGASLVTGLVARRTAGVNQIWFCIDWGVGGVLGVRIKRDTGTSYTDLAGTPTAGTYTAGQRIKARCVWDGDDLRMRVWPEASQEPTTWTAVATDTVCAGSAVGMQLWRVAGNTNSSPVLFSVDALEIEAVEISGTVPAWPVRWDPTATQSWAPIEIAGIGRRLAQGAAALRSSMYRQISALSTLVGYWPVEDGSSATAIANALPNGAAGAVQGMQLGGAGPAGSAGAATFSNADPSSKISGAFVSASATAGWQISWSCKLPALPTATTQMLAWYTTNGYWWAINVAPGSYVVSVIDPSGTQVVSTPIINTGTGDPNQWVTFRMKSTQSGGTVTWQFAWFVQGSAAPWGLSGTFSGAVGALRSWTANGNPSMQGASICHVFGVTTGNDDLQSYAALRSFDGYVGEAAAARVARLCNEQGVPVTVEAGASEPMGAQRPNAFLTLLRECEAADSGILYEAGAGLGYRPRTARYNRPVAMTLSIAGLDVADPAPEPTDDDQRVSNEWTVNRDGGSEYTADDPDHIALNGHYPQSTTINVADDSRLSYQAQWRVHIGTWGEMRWPQITLDLTDRPDLLAAWRGRPFGARIVISGVPSQGPIGDTVDLIAEGWTQEIRSDSWRVTLNCSPARIWDVGVYSSSTSRYDSASTTLPSQVAAGATSFTVSTANLADTWSTKAASQPYDLLISGARITVPVGGMGAVSGSGPYTQVISGAIWGVNGITKILPVGAEVHIATPGRYAL